MKIQRRLSVLDRIYTLYDAFIASYDLACQHGCAACCTCNMTLTTLEGYRILADMDAAARISLFEKVGEVFGNRHFQPQMTINTIAQLCKDGEPVPDETIDPSWGACPLLLGDACPFIRCGLLAAAAWYPAWTAATPDMPTSMTLS
jgi:hypothetical protein